VMTSNLMLSWLRDLLRSTSSTWRRYSQKCRRNWSVQLIWLELMMLLLPNSYSIKDPYISRLSICTRPK
jgi:hypothetical protein